ncbi:DUF2892 domain-containing protein [Fictibacillus sp. Mic-4]|uniref:YgaP family membrane protein n=1 Tax=Fictibacillus TaxID=1329200 RepID=UPI000426B9A3|nr:DUF2892 domain-containing protein [Fictibacillus gelatini]
MKKNIGTANAFIRIICGLTVLAVFTARYARRPYRGSYLLLIMMGAMKVAEGIVRFCPLTELFNRCNLFNQEDSSMLTNDKTDVNPS